MVGLQWQELARDWVAALLPYYWQLLASQQALPLVGLQWGSAHADEGLAL